MEICSLAFRGVFLLRKALSSVFPHAEITSSKNAVSTHGACLFMFLYRLSSLNASVDSWTNLCLLIHCQSFPIREFRLAAEHHHVHRRRDIFRSEMPGFRYSNIYGYIGVGGNDDLSQQNMPTQGIFAVITHHQDGEAAVKGIRNNLH